MAPGSEACRADCTLLPCGDPSDDGVSVSDALIALQTAISLAICDPCLCDVDSDEAVTVTDALKILQRATGQMVDLDCPTCVGAS